MEFRKDINGLRAFAVMAVVLYHFDLAGFHGGFAGVDVFFVISGFLMTGIILGRLQAGPFSLWGFYMNRVRRIVPALVVMSLALLGFGYLWLIPHDYEFLGKHVSGAVTFVSNFIFKGEDGYFDAPMRDKWMLHTWSLSVEWQFYLIYPLALMAVKKYSRSRNYMALLLGAFFVTLIASVIVSPKKPDFSFYILPTRIWEFMAGAVVYVLSQKRQTALSRNSAAVEFLGMALVLASFLVVNSDMVWPGYAALLPVIGASLVILAGRDNSVMTGNVVAQWLGKTSYSIYLWHWPVFIGLGYFGKEGLGWALAGVAASLLLGAASYAFVETPCRQKNFSPKILFGGALLATLLGFAVFMKDGVESRVSPETLAVNHAIGKIFETEAGCGFLKGDILKRCHTGQGEKVGFAIWGDSHAGALAKGITETLKGKGLLYTFGGCPTIFDVRLRSRAHVRCKQFDDAVFEDIKRLPKDVPVVVVNRFSYYLHGFNEGIKRVTGLDYLAVPEEEVKRNEEAVFKKSIVSSLCRIAEARKKVYVVQPVPEMGRDVPKTLARRLMMTDAAEDISISKEDYDSRHKAALEALQQARRQCGVTLLDPVPYLCKKGRCYGSLDRRPLYFDDDHLNDEGSRRLAPLFARIK